MVFGDFMLSEVYQIKKLFLYDINYKVIRIGKFLGLEESRRKGFGMFV